MQRGGSIGVGVLCAVCVITLVPGVCAAAPPDAGSANTQQTTRRWYGWQTLSADTVAGGLFLAAAAHDHDTTLFGLSGVTFGLGAPAIHLAHGNWDIALGSLGLRTLGPFLGAVIGAASDVRVRDDANGRDGSSSKWTIVGAGIGGLVVSAIDGSFLAYDTRVSSSPSQAKYFPQLLVLRQGLGVGLSGQF